MERPEKRVALIEWLDRAGHVLRSTDVAAWPLSLGRALDNTVVLDDAHVAAHHARIELDAEGRLQLQALPSLNGLQLDGRAVAAQQPQALAAGAAPVLQLGATRLRLRLAGATLAPELPLPAARQRDWPLLLPAGGVVALAGVTHWLSLDPGAEYTAWLGMALGWAAGIVLWAGLWALLSKLFQQRFDFMGHLRIALPWLLAAALAEALIPLLGAALAWPRLWWVGTWVAGLLYLGLLNAHLRHLLPQHRRAATVTLASLAASLVTVGLVEQWRQGSPMLQPSTYMSTLPTPALRWTGTVPSAQLVQEMAPLTEALARRVEEARQDEAENGLDGDAADEE